MRKKIALFSNGWSSEFLQEIGQGIKLAATRADVDIFVFANYSSSVDSLENTHGEFSIFKLPDISKFDGAIVMANTFNQQVEFDYIQKELIRTGIPAISMEYRLEGADYFGSDDYSGMSDLAEHLICDHGVKEIVYMGGIKGHTGNAVRLKAVKDMADRFNVVIPEENILCGDFAANPAVREIAAWIEKYGHLPEAIVCANDIMAIGICDYLKDNGYEIPRDTIVTGFDCLKVSQEYSPSITTVTREWFSMGVKCVEKLLQKMEGKTISSEEEVPTSLVCGESCGCVQEDYYPLQKTIRKPGGKKYIDGFYCDQHFRHMYLYLRRVETAKELNDSLSAFFLNEGWLEGEDVLMAFNHNFFIMEDWKDDELDSFPDEMDIVCSVRDKKASPISRMNKQDAIFDFANANSAPGIYIFVPIRLDTTPLGFAVISKGFSIFQNDILYLWCRHMSEYMEQVLANIKISHLTKRLESLSVTDGLTGVYNRTGCESIIYPALSKNQHMNGRSILMIVDLDRLKYINDTFGHGSGDIAICTTVKAMKKALSDEFMIGRYGGDEFLIAGCVKEEMDLRKIADDISNALIEEAKKIDVPYKISASVGGLQLKVDEEFDINECIKIADENMYKEKTIHHQQQD